jgi:predicted nucleic acid-binding protein
LALVFDAEVLLARFLGEPGAAKAVDLLDRVAAGKEKGYVSRVNLAEVYYRLERHGKGKARGPMVNLALDGVEAVPCEAVWEVAGTLKARHPDLSLAEAFAAATAKHVRGDLVVLRDEALLQACRAEGVAVRRIR